MKKSTIALLLLLCSLPLRASDPWEMWLDQTMYGKINKNVEVQLNSEQRIIDDIGTLAYLQIEPTIRFRIKKEHYFSLQVLQLWDRVSHQKWEREFEPEFTLNNKVKIGHVNYISRIQFVYRWYETARAHRKKGNATLRIRPGFEFFKNSWFKLYAQNEFLYNYHNLHGLDENRLSMGIRGTIENFFTWDIYFLHRDNKTAPGAHRKGTHVLGLAITIHT